jgi:hypothetical protein
MRRSMSALALAGLLSVTVGAGAMLAGSASRTVQPVSNLWDPATVVGEASLVRTGAGLTAAYRSTDLPAGQAVTLWFIVFNNPSACAATCGLWDLLFNLEAEGDFLVGGGHVTGADGKGGFGGHLAVGDTSGSAFPEIGMPSRPIGLSNPWGAQVTILLHSHGPAMSGPDLVSQMSSFTGGCDVFLGDLELPGSGLADGPEDVPDAPGECSTFQGTAFLP